MSNRRKLRGASGRELAALMRDLMEFSDPACPIDERAMALLVKASQVTVHRELCALERQGFVIRGAGRFYRAGLVVAR